MADAKPDTAPIRLGSNLTGLPGVGKNRAT
jgi:hypothetical protein